ncbi:MAG: PAS domain-containing protein [Deltaproteobacteria bacterium]|nr:PAS domain-containing protein [Deltaproteobacteria bacterium]
MADTAVVGIGASAGGLEALEQFFAELPIDSGLAFVVVQHLSPTYRSLMDELLARHTQMPIVRAEQGMPLKPNTIVLNLPRTQLRIVDGLIDLEHVDGGGSPYYPIDAFFRSLANYAEERAVAVVLSGSGADGARGVRAVKEAGGLVMVQAEADAKFRSMPRSACPNADVVAPARELPGRLLDFVKRRYSATEHEAPVEGRGDAIARVIGVLKARGHADFSSYRETTLARRIERRIALQNTGSVDDYLNLLRGSEEEQQRLATDLLIGVTRFFRDPRSWDVLRTECIPRLISSGDGPLRLWSAGCASGEEAYSLAIIVSECLAEVDSHRDVKIFATDADHRAVESASDGFYPEGIAADMSADRLNRHFIPAGDGYQVARDIRELVIFARHNLLYDPPFTRMDLIACRNLLIYLKPEVQRDLCEMFSFALRPGGYLFMGSSEALPDGLGMTAVEGTRRIYLLNEDRGRSREPNPRRKVERSEASLPVPRIGARRWARETRLTHSPLEQAYQHITGQLAPPSLLIDAENAVRHAFGDVRRFVRIPKGSFSTDVTKLAAEPLRPAVATALAQVRGGQASASFSGVKVDDEGLVEVRVDAIDGGAFFLLSFRAVAESTEQPTANYDDSAVKGERIRELEVELQRSREGLQATVEELATANEELQSTNQELLVSNEELQSTNEELHSVNEELHTVNAEYQRKIVELNDLSDDFRNLLRTADIGTLFVDCDLVIRRMTLPIQRVISVVESDIGRSLGHFTHAMEGVDLVAAIQQVIATGDAYESEARGPGGRAMLLRVTPFITRNGLRDGAVVSVFDIAELARVRDQLKQRTAELERINHEHRQLARIVSHDFTDALGAIVDYAQGIRGSCSQSAMSPCNDLLTPLTAAASRLRALAADLLTLTSLGAQASARQSVDLNLVAGEVLTELSGEIERLEAQVQLRPLPMVFANQLQMHQLLRNLAENALRYHQRDRSPVLEIKGEVSNGRAMIQVIDQGIGVDPADSERVFSALERLDTEYEGTGIGLAICKKIVVNHGGEIRLDSQVGRGTTVTITLPTTDGQNASRPEGAS